MIETRERARPLSPDERRAAIIDAVIPLIREMVNRDLTRIARKDWTLTCGEDEFHAARGAGKYAVAARQRSTRSS